MVMIKVPNDSEIGRLLREAEASGEPLTIDTGDATYTVRREDREHHRSDDDSTAHEYDPEQAREAMSRAAGSWGDIDAEAFKQYIYDARKAGTRGLDRP